MLRYLFNLLFTVYTFMLLVRAVGSWFPDFAASKFMHFIAFYTEPYLRVFRKIIPMIGPVDVSPVVALFVLWLIQRLFFSF